MAQRINRIRPPVSRDMARTLVEVVTFTKERYLARDFRACRPWFQDRGFKIARRSLLAPMMDAKKSPLHDRDQANIIDGFSIHFWQSVSFLPHS